MSALLLVSELEDYTISYANGLALHMPVTVCVPRRRYGHLADAFSPAVDLRLLDWPRHSSAANPAFVASLVRLVRETRPSVVHLLSHTVLWLNLAIPLFGRRPVITTVHDVVVHPGDRETRVVPRWSTDLCVRQSDHLVVHGEHLRDVAMARFGRPAGEVHVLSHPAIVRYAEIAEREGMQPVRSDSRFRLLMFGRIFAYKGLEQLIAAEAALGGTLPELSVTIAGRGDDPWAFREAMGDPARYDVRNRFIEDREVAQLFLDCDAVVLPYTEASQSGVLNVAVAFGKPVIVTDVGELGTTVRGAGIGLVVPPNDPAALAAAIARLATDPAERSRLGHNARTYATGRNAPAQIGAKAAALYHSIAAEAAARSGAALPAAGPPRIPGRLL